MRKKILRSMAAALIITSVASTTVFPVLADDDVNTLKNQKNTEQSELSQLENELSYVLVQIDNLEKQAASLTEEIETVNTQLSEAEEKQNQQYEDMKLRIKYMYEDRTASISDVFLSSADMSEVLNKTVYLQSVYTYDRDKLQEMADTAKEISDLKTKLDDDRKALDTAQASLTEKQAALYTSIDSKKASIANYDSLIASAAEKAAAAVAARQTTSSSSSTNKAATTTTVTAAKGDNATANRIVSLAYNYIGYNYVTGGASPSSGFDCSGLIYYVFGQAGVSVARTSSAQAAGGTRISSISEAQPGDVICYPGHVGIYIGNNMMIHAPVPGKQVTTINVYGLGMSITSIRRYW